MVTVVAVTPVLEEAVLLPEVGLPPLEHAARDSTVRNTTTCSGLFMAAPRTTGMPYRRLSKTKARDQ
jgi:hypothetical protein